MARKTSRLIGQERVIGVAIDTTPAPTSKSFETAVAAHLFPLANTLLHLSHANLPPNFLYTKSDIDRVVINSGAPSMDQLLNRGYPGVHLLFGTFVSGLAWINYWQEIGVLGRKRAQTFSTVLANMFKNRQMSVLCTIIIPPEKAVAAYPGGRPDLLPHDPYPLQSLKKYNDHLRLAHHQFKNCFAISILIDNAFDPIHVLNETAARLIAIGISEQFLAPAPTSPPLV